MQDYFYFLSKSWYFKKKIMIFQFNSENFQPLFKYNKESEFTIARQVRSNQKWVVLTATFVVGGRPRSLD